jgi:hypothetical protein
VEAPTKPQRIHTNERDQWELRTASIISAVRTTPQFDFLFLYCAGMIEVESGPPPGIHFAYTYLQ